MPKARTTCTRCGWNKTAHQTRSPQHQDICDRFTADWEPRVKFPDYTPSGGPWDPDDPNRAIFFLELPDDDWTVAYGLMVKSGVVTVAEMRLYPTDTPGMPVTGPGEWSRNEAEIPTGGIGTSLLRRYRVREVYERMPTIMRELHGQLGEERFRALFSDRGIPSPVIDALSPTKGESGPPDPHEIKLAQIAKAYTEEIARGNHRYAEALAARFNYSPATIRSYITHARRRGLLTEAPGPRQPGGALTSYAEALLTLLPDETGTGQR